MRPVEDCHQIADWAAENMHNGIIALGLGGPEVGNPPEVFQEVFERITAASLPSLPHAGETEGPESIWGAIKALSAVRIGHGVRCLEDPELVRYLRKNQIPLDVCPTSNVCLGVVPSFAEHPLPQLLDEGLLITINSDDPPMFDTTLTDEYLRIVEAYDFDISLVKQLVLNGIKASLLPKGTQQSLDNEFRYQFLDLENELGL
jgi:adenosine deaminase